MISTSNTSSSIIIDLLMHPREFNIPLQQAHAFGNTLFQNTKNFNTYSPDNCVILRSKGITFIFFKTISTLLPQFGCLPFPPVYPSVKWGLKIPIS